MSMGMSGWIGGAVGGTGSAMQFMAAGKRERATERVANKMEAAGKALGAEKFQISDNLRKALESISDTRQEMTGDYFQRRLSPDRTVAAQENEKVQVDSGAAGMARALGSIAGPPQAYHPGTAAFAASREGFDTRREQPTLQAVLDRIANEGYLTGAQNYDQGNQQQLAMDQRPLDNEAQLRQLLTGVRQGETQFNFDQLMSDLQRQMQDAQHTGDKEAFWGSILQNIGTGIAGGTDFSYTSPNGAAKPGTTGGGDDLPAIEPPSQAQIDAYNANKDPYAGAL
jgi:hypothetical protein